MNMPAIPPPSMLPAALWWAGLGIPIFPIWWPVDGRCACPAGQECASPGKHPLTPRGLHDATIDEAAIRSWWARWPLANIAAPTGGEFDAVDIDAAIKAWKEFVARHGTPRHMAIVKSGRPGGGYHLYCFPGGQKTIPSGKRGLPPGVEIKGVGGYVVVPPSIHVSGQPYTWINSIADAIIEGDVDYATWYAALDDIAAQSTPPRAALPAQPALPPSDATRAERYGQAVLARAVNELTTAGEGGRWNALALVSVPLVARAIAGGCLTRQAGEQSLADAARAAGLTAGEVDRIPELLDRITAQGIRMPIRPPEQAADQDAASWARGIVETPPAPDYADDLAEPIERTTWWPRDLGPVINGTEPEPGPAYLTRDDGRALFYPGKVNGLIGESESGKTWVALLAVQQALATGQNVLYLDFEDTAAGIVSRLRAMGAPDEHLARLTYVDPTEGLSMLARRDLAEAIAAAPPRLVVLDGFNAAMTLMGLDLNSNTDATAFAQQLLRPLARTDAAVVYVDHVPKNKEARGKGGIGAQAKRAMTTGAAIAVDVVAEFGRGMTGRLRLTVDKDRPGHVRAVSAQARYAGEAVLASNPDGTVAVTIAAPDLRPASQRGPWRPTFLMEQVSLFLGTVPGGASVRAIREGVPGKSEHVAKAIDRLVIEGYVARRQGQRGALVHVLERAFEEAFDSGWEGDDDD